MNKYQFFAFIMVIIGLAGLCFSKMFVDIPHIVLNRLLKTKFGNIIFFGRNGYSRKQLSVLNLIISITILTLGIIFYLIVFIL
jgi:hypothetical protein